MKTSVIKIGNSKGIKLSDNILEQCHIGKEVELQLENDYIIIKPLNINKPRANWDKAFAKMRDNNEDKLIINDNIDLDLI